jgi:Dyp-type peroxidase family
LLLAVDDDRRARAYLMSLCARLNVAKHSPKHTALQLAFTAPGLVRLGVPASALRTFSREFLEGMDDDVRSAALGDRGDNDPKTWDWGARTGAPVHALLMLYAHDEDVLRELVKAELDEIGNGFTVVTEKHTTSRRDQKEHFGWRDGLSMPKIAGVPSEGPRKKRQESWTDPLPPGEFVLGYRNDYDAFTECPTADDADDQANDLPRDPAGARKSLGRNGTYLVYRELVQDVLALWDYLAKQSRERGADEVTRAIALGAKMVGRWPGGAPLVDSPDADRPELATANTFHYAKDEVGLRCPPGAHIRRANPRDVVAPDRGAATSLVMVRKHQMIRRGRPFGPPVSETMDPREILAKRGAPDRERRGLHFLCIVGDIKRQFEFVQRAWIHSANFAAQFKDGDPISAARRPPGDDNSNDEFTCPAAPVRRKYKQMPQFTRLVGGAYFFLPGVAALRFIARAR